MIGLGQLLYKSFNEEPQDIYFRKVEQADRDNFESEQIGAATIYRKTREISLNCPQDPMTEQLDQSISQISIPIIDGILTGGLVSKITSLLGVFVFKTKYSLLIGVALGAIKAYIHYTQKPRSLIFCFKSKLLDELDQEKVDLEKRKTSRTEEEVKKFNLKNEGLSGKLLDVLKLNEEQISTADRNKLRNLFLQIENFYLIKSSEPEPS